MQLSKNFVLQEFTRSQQATRLGISNTPGPQEIQNLMRLCDNILEPIRSAWKKPLSISSGYRSPAVNSAIGGSQTSQHCFGFAADIEINGVDNRELANWIRTNLNYDQLILEFYNPAEGPNSGWVHVSYVSPKQNRKQDLTASIIAGKTKYTPGISF